MASDFSLRFKEKYGRLPNPDRLAQLLQDKSMALKNILKIELDIEEEEMLREQFNKALWEEHDN